MTVFRRPISQARSLQDDCAGAQRLSKNAVSPRLAWRSAQTAMEDCGLSEGGESHAPEKALARSTRSSSGPKPPPCCGTTPYMHPCQGETISVLGAPSSTWPRGVTVSTLDPESSDRSSNPREAFFGSRHGLLHPKELMSSTQTHET